MSFTRAPYSRNQRSLFIATYPPQQCGIATFTHDLYKATAKHLDLESAGIIAVSENPCAYDYPSEVVLKFDRNSEKSYRAVAEYINFSNYDTVCIQHEFGIFGGDEGGYLLELLRALRKPVITTLHTVLAEPADNYLRRLQQVVDLSDAVVALTPKATEILRDVYGTSPRKVRVIQHGIPDLEFTDSAPYKEKLGARGRMVIMTFGLIGPSKGIEDMIDALPSIVERHPEVLYMIVGATHPGVIASQGEGYRHSLERKVADLGLQKNVLFVNRYLGDEELYEHLKACDIYVTPYPHKEQISSGTLAYATGLGKAVVSTSYWYAQDLLSGKRGMLVEPHSPGSLSRAINHLIEHDDERNAMRRRAFEFGRKMTWSNVAKEYLTLFEEVARARFTRLPAQSNSVLEHARQNSLTVAQQQLAKSAALRRTLQIK
jgi:glycosyltransferase involved in cell wall biosynthesis